MNKFEATILINPDLTNQALEKELNSIKSSIEKIEVKDSDGDMVCDGLDPFPTNPNEWKDTDGDGYGDNSDAFPNDPAKSLDYEEIKLEPQIEGGLLDSSMLVIVGLGAVYFLFKKFTK